MFGGKLDTDNKKPINGKKLQNTNKPVVLIVENDPEIAFGLAMFFHSKNYYVYVESNIDNARSKLQVFDYTQTLVDLAFVQNQSDSKGLVFSEYLHSKYPKIKTVLVLEKDQKEPETQSACVYRDDNIEAVCQEAHDVLHYSKEGFKTHIRNAREKEKQLREEEKLRKLAFLSKYTPEQIAAAEEKRRGVACKLAPMILKLFKEWDNIYLRRQNWKELVGKSKVYKQDIKIMKIVSMFRIYKKNQLKNKTAA